MITSIRYSGEAKKEIDGEKGNIQVTPRFVLLTTGPFIQVTISQPKEIAEKLIKEKKTVPIISVKALIDTGAFGTVISPSVAEKLNLIQTGFQKVSSVQDEQVRPAYFACIRFPWGSGKEVPVVSCPLKQYECLIGRDILQHWYMTYNGTEGNIVICD